MIKQPQRRRPRPDLGCRAIGWMDVQVFKVIITVIITDDTIISSLCKTYEACSDETLSETFLFDGVETIEVAFVGIEAGIPLTHQPMDPLRK
jgi:hypothetical protein